MDVTRIIDLPSKTYVEEGDYIAIDNQQDGTQKVQFTNLFDDSLSQSDKIAPANKVGQQFINITQDIADVEAEINALKAAVGSPLKASTIAQMTDTNKIYVYTGSESGYTAGNWYYYNGTAWVSGGVYNSTALETDKTLTVSDMAADAKVTGNALNAVQNPLIALNEGEYAFNPKGWIYGYYLNGELVTANNRILSEMMMLPKGYTFKNTALAGYVWRIVFFNDDFSFASVTNEYYNNTENVITIGDYHYFRLQVRFSDGSDIPNPATGENITLTVLTKPSFTIAKNNSAAVEFAKRENTGNRTINITSWAQGRLFDGVPVADTTRIYTPDYYPTEMIEEFRNVIHPGYVADFCWFDEDKVYTGYTRIFMNTQNSVKPEGRYFRVCVRHSDSTVINVSDGANCIFYSYDYNPTNLDKLMLKVGKNSCIAHRGMAFYFPENTIPSFLAAANLGMPMCETDIQKTKDGEWILMHDGTVDRTTDGTGNVADLTFAQIEQMNVDIIPQSPVATFTNLKVPTLKEYLNLCREYKMFPICEFKRETFSGSEQNVFDCLNYIRNLGFGTNEFAVLSVALDVIESVKKYNADIITFYIPTESYSATILQDFRDLARYSSMVLALQNSTIPQEVIDLCNVTGMKMWASVSTYQEYLNNKEIYPFFMTWNTVFNANLKSECKTYYIGDGTEDIALDLSNDLNIKRDVVVVFGDIRSSSDVVVSLGGVNGSSDYGILNNIENWTSLNYWMIPIMDSRRTFTLSGTGKEYKRITVKVFKNCF